MKCDEPFFKKENLERASTLVRLNISFFLIKIQVFRLWIICAADAGAAQVSQDNQQEPITMGTQRT